MKILNKLGVLPLLVCVRAYLQTTDIESINPTYACVPSTDAAFTCTKVYTYKERTVSNSLLLHINY